MKILHVCSYFSTSKLFSQLFDRQVDSDLDIKVYVPIAQEYPKERIASTGDYTSTVRTHKQNDRYIFHYKHHKILKDILERYDIESFDLIHAHSLFSNGWIAYQLYKRFNIPYVVAVRSADVETFFKKAKWLWPIGMNILRHASQIIFISQNSYNEVFERYIPRRLQTSLRAKTQVITNGIEDYWHNNRYNNKSPQLHTPLQVVSTAKILPGKRLHIIAEALQDYQKKREVEFHIIGPAWNQKVLDELMQYPFVRYHGPKNNQEMVEIYRQMDVFALLSYPETFGLVYVEAMSQGLPVIYTKNEGFDSFFSENTVGVSVRRNDVAGFVQALDTILENYEDYMTNALEGSQEFEWDTINKRYLAIYNNLI